MNKFLEEAYLEAERSLKTNDIPVGAVIVKDKKIISRAHNISYNTSITNHAEIIAINDAINKLDDWRLTDCEMYVTLEPCPMCAGAIVQSRIKKVFIGCESKIKSNKEIINSIFNNDDYYHMVEVEYLNDSSCSKIISDFFKIKR